MTNLNTLKNLIKSAQNENGLFVTHEGSEFHLWIKDIDSQGKSKYWGKATNDLLSWVSQNAEYDEWGDDTYQVEGQKFTVNYLSI